MPKGTAAAKEKKNNHCFVIAPIGDEGSEIRKRSDQVLKHIIKPAAKECGYEVIRADQMPKPGMITLQIIQHIMEDSLVVADLTGYNPNVFYELAVRHAVRKPCVQIIQEGQSLPFDVAQNRTISVDHRDLDSVEDCRTKLANQIRSVEKDPSDVDSPISVVVDLQALRSDNPLAKSVEEIMAMLSGILTKVDEMSSGGPDPRTLGIAHNSVSRALLQLSEAQETVQHSGPSDIGKHVQNRIAEAQRELTLSKHTLMAGIAAKNLKMNSARSWLDSYSLSRSWLPTGPGPSKIADAPLTSSSVEPTNTSED